MNEAILHRIVSNCYDYLLTFSLMQSRWNELIVSCRKLNVSSSKMEKRLALLYEFWQTRDNLNSYTRLDYTILPLLRHLTYLWLCPSFGFSSLLWLSLLLWLSFYEALQSCSDPNWATRSGWKKKSNNLFQIKTCHLIKWKKVSFFFYIYSGNPEATLILTPD